MKYLIFLLILLIAISPTLAQWQIQNIGISEDLNDVVVLNETTAVVVGNNGTILKTTNNGNEWEQKTVGQQIILMQSPSLMIKMESQLGMKLFAELQMQAKVG